MLSLDPIQFWHWWAFGGLLLIIEVFVSGFVFLWLAIAAGLVGLLLLLWPTLELNYQVLVFSLLSVVSVVGWRRVQRARPAVTDQPHLNRRGAQYVGHRVPLVAPIVNGHGRVKLADATWAARGPDLPAGQLVQITGIDGVILIVEAIDRPAADPVVDRPTGAGSDSDATSATP